MIWNFLPYLIEAADRTTIEIITADHQQEEKEKKPMTKNAASVCPSPLVPLDPGLERSFCFNVWPRKTPL